PFLVFLGQRGRQRQPTARAVKERAAGDAARGASIYRSGRDAGRNEQVIAQDRKCGVPMGSRAAPRLSIPLLRASAAGARLAGGRDHRMMYAPTARSCSGINGQTEKRAKGFEPSTYSLGSCHSAN